MSKFFISGDGPTLSAGLGVGALITASVRDFFGRALVPQMRFVLWFFVKIKSFRTLRVGKTTFYGPEAFLNLCQQAMEKLKDLDGALFLAITRTAYVFWYDQCRPIHFNRHYAINDGSCGWKEAGVIAALVYAHYRSSLESHSLPLSGRDALESFKREMRNKTLLWLLKNDFPAELANYYANV